MIPDILHFRIERHHDEKSIYYVVSGVEIALTTEGDTIEDTLRNLREAVELYYEDDNLSHLPRIEATLEVTPEYA
jgi:predicted RNase H-like HicB family nuclease